VAHEYDGHLERNIGQLARFGTDDQRPQVLQSASRPVMLVFCISELSFSFVFFCGFAAVHSTDRCGFFSCFAVTFRRSLPCPAAKTSEQFILPSCSAAMLNGGQSGWRDGAVHGSTQHIANNNHNKREKQSRCSHNQKSA